ncbi:MAG: exodeoxyribonuclease V subunit alpha [Gammaproteobacteria bacterium]|nr:exodeoxyribonuclease V subunit alpha [Gammaproteobacteria bacterium]
MSSLLYTLMENGVIPAISYYFSRFVSQSNQQNESSILAYTAALVSERNVAGDVCVELAQYENRPLFRTGASDVFIPKGLPLNKWIVQLQQCNWVGQPGETAPLILDGGKIYLGKYWHYEHSLAKEIISRCDSEPELDKAYLKESLNKLFPVVDSTKPDWQKLAAATALIRSFSVISGGPGTGKTTTVSKVLALLLGLEPELRVALVAPTGKAAARLSESISRAKNKLELDPDIINQIPDQAMTIHRLLRYRQGRFQHDHENKLLIDCLLVDEASMVDLPLMAKLIAAVPEHARIILLGDRDQLASVEAGKVLGDITGHNRELIYSDKHVQLLEEIGAAPINVLSTQASPPVVSDSIAILRESYRFNKNSGIGKLASAVNQSNGQVAYDYAKDSGYTDIEWVNVHSHKPEPSYLDWAIAQYKDYLQQDTIEQALASFEQHRILAAIQDGPLGVKTINQTIEARMMEQGLISLAEYYHGKPIMIVENDYETGLYNGDTGLIWQVEGEGMFACFAAEEGGIRRLPVRQLPDHVTAFAITVHKSQGSEFENVLLILPDEDTPILTKELVYTGITRAKESLVVAAEMDLFISACSRTVARSSGLAGRLGWS